MAKITGVRPTGFDTPLDIRTVNAMTSHGSKQCVGSSRHMAVVTLAARRFGTVVGVLFQLAADFLVTLDAGFVVASLLLITGSVGGVWFLLVALPMWAEAIVRRS